MKKMLRTIKAGMFSGNARRRSWGSGAAASRLASEVLSLPMGPHLTATAVAAVIDQVRAACSSLAKTHP